MHALVTLLANQRKRDGEMLQQLRTTETKLYVRRDMSSLLAHYHV